MPVKFTSEKYQFHILKNSSFLFSVLILLAFIVFAAAAAAQPIPVDAFWQQVATTLTWLDSPHSAPEWAAQAKSWSEIKQVSLPNGQTVTADTSEVVRQLTIDPPDAAQLKAYLMTLAAMRSDWPQADCGDCKTGLLSEILARPEFAQQDSSSNPVQQFFQQILDAVVSWLNNLFGGSGRPAAIPPEVFILIISVLLAGILIYVFRDVFANLSAEAELAGEAGGGDEALTASLASQKALQLSGAGDYRSAMRYLYLSALLLLDERGLLRYNRSLTNREYLQMVRGQPELENNLKVIVDEFDRVWYGFQPIDPQEYARYVGHVSAIEALKK